MGKNAAERSFADNEAMAFSKHIRVSSQKLNLVAESIRGMDCELALAELKFSRRRIANEVKKILEAYPKMCGVFDWEYFDAPPDDQDPSFWCTLMKRLVN